jgi:hypothetical protein
MKDKPFVQQLMIIIAFVIAGTIINYLLLTYLNDGFFAYFFVSFSIVLFYFIPFIGLQETKYAKYIYLAFIVLLAVLNYKVMISILNAYLKFILLFISTITGMNLNPYVE